MYDMSNCLGIYVWVWMYDMSNCLGIYVWVWMYDMSETQLVLKDMEIINFLDFFENLLLEFF